MKKALLTLLTLALAACGSDSVKVNTHLDRIEQLEIRAELNDQLNILQNQQIADLMAALAAEEAARIAGDQTSANNLSIVVGAQSLTNLLLQLQINSLRNRINNIEDDLEDLQLEVNNLTVYILELEEDLQEQITDLAGNSQVEVIKPCPNAAERLLKIDGVLYGVMNHISTNGNSNNVNGVKIALEPLNNGSYSTTSNSGNCTFTVSNGEVL